MHYLTTLTKQLLVLIRQKTRASALPKPIMPRKIMLHGCQAVSLCASTGKLVQHSKPTLSILDMETRNESGLEKPATFNSAHVQKAHVLSGHGNAKCRRYCHVSSNSKLCCPKFVSYTCVGVAQAQSRGDNSSDGRVVRISASGAADSGLISSRVKSMTLKLIFITSLIEVQHKRVSVRRRTSRQVYQLCHWERHLTELPILVWQTGGRLLLSELVIAH